MNPKRPLAYALTQALQGVLLDERGQVVPVYEVVPREYRGGAYVLVSQYTAAETTGGECRDGGPPAWRCTVLVDALTPFAAAAEASADPGDLLTEQVQTRVRNLEGQPLAEGYTVNRVAVELTNGFGEDGPDKYWLHNPTRLVFNIS